MVEKKAKGHTGRFMETAAFLKQMIWTNFRGGLKWGKKALFVKTKLQNMDFYK